MDDNVKHVNEEIYKKNFELAIKNKTLSVLRRLYDIAISSLDITEIAQKIVDTIVMELNFSAAIIALVDVKKQVLRPVAITRSPEILQSLAEMGKSLSEVVTPLNFKNNLSIVAIDTKERQITANLLDILDPHVTQEMADKIENLTKIKTIVVYPLILGKKVLGVFIVGLAKRADDLSLAEKQTLEELISIVAISLDRASLHKELEIANDHLRELDKMKDEFISIASHELRSPAAVVKDYLWSVLDEARGITPDIRQDLEKAAAANQRLVQLVNDLLDISRIEGGRLELRPEEFELKSLVMEIVEEKKYKVKLNLGDGKVVADRDKIRQVIVNLVDNAIKYSGGKPVEIKMIDDRVEIKDQGVGIDPEQKDRLFSKFGRLNTYDTAIGKVGGTGLGLFICKKIVELSGGQMGYESVYGQGSTFWFTLRRS